MKRLLFCLLFCTILLVTLFVVFVTFGPSQLLLDIHPQAIDESFPKSFTGPLMPNHILSSVQKLFVNQIHGPESIAVYNGSVFTGTDDGFIYKIDANNNLEAVIKVINIECPHVWNRTSCGRPLGMKFDSNGVLYVVEPSHGIYTVDNILTSNPIVRQVLDIKHTEVLGKSSRFIDDFAIDESEGHVLYISDISTKYTIHDTLSAMSDSNTGRLISYNTATKKLDTLLSELYFPNGVELTDDKSAVLFAESLTRRVIKHYIRGPKSGQTIELISSLPGEPDNIRRSATKRETYWLTFSMARDESNQLFIDTMNRHPLLKKFIIRLTYHFGSALDIIGDWFGCNALRELGFGIKSGYIPMLIAANNTHCMAIEFDVNGGILQSLQSPDGSVSVISEAREVRISDNESVLYLGSYFNNYLGKLVLNNRV